MKSFGSIGSFLWALLLVLLAFICTGNSYKQEMGLYDEFDNGLLFRAPVSDTSDYSLALARATRSCTRGRWIGFNTVNFTNYTISVGDVWNPDIVCYNFSSAGVMKSFRHMGASDTDTDALSLYDGERYAGNEIFITAGAHIGITTKIIGIAATGTSDWTLFEGQALDGKSICYEVPYTFWHFNHDAVKDLNMTTIGSVFKGCDAQEIQNYKMLHMSEYVNSN